MTRLWSQESRALSPLAAMADSCARIQADSLSLFGRQIHTTAYVTTSNQPKPEVGT